MQKGASPSKVKVVLLTVLATAIIIFFVLPWLLSSWDKTGNVALIKINGMITSNGASSLGESTLSAEKTISFIQEAEKNPLVKVIVLEINSPGGTPVASDEVAAAVKHTKKPTIAVIREVGTSGAYWTASASDYVLAQVTGFKNFNINLSSQFFPGLFQNLGGFFELGRIRGGDGKAKQGSASFGLFFQ